MTHKANIKISKCETNKNGYKYTPKTLWKVIDDLDLICFPSDPPYSERKKALWWLAKDGNKPVAYAGLELFKEHRYAFLCRAGVIPEYRGKGLQVKLIRARVNYAFANNIPYVLTYTSPYNLASSNNLIKEGFRLYRPECRWAGVEMLYWQKSVK